MRIYNDNIYSWPWNCCWKTGRSIANYFNLNTNIVDEYLNLPTEDLAIKKLIEKYGDLFSGFKSLAIETGFKKIRDIEEYNTGDIGIFENKLFGGAMTIFYDNSYQPPDQKGDWLIWTPTGMRQFNKQFYPDIDLSLFRGRI